MSARKAVRIAAGATRAARPTASRSASSRAFAAASARCLSIYGNAALARKLAGARSPKSSPEVGCRLALPPGVELEQFAGQLRLDAVVALQLDKDAVGLVMCQRREPPLGAWDDYTL